MQIHPDLWWRKPFRDGADHPVELHVDLGADVSRDRVQVGELGGCPPGVADQVIHPWHPVGVHRRLPVLRVLAAIPVDFQRVGSRGDAYDHSVAESVIGLPTTAVILHGAPWHALDDVEYATMEWVAWINTCRRREPLGYLLP
jgi:hypothetical protein